MTLLEAMNYHFPLSYYPEIFLRIVIACLCGAVIGLERTKRLKAAGIRTHCLIAVTAAALMILSKYAFADLTSIEGLNYAGTRGADSARIAAQVVSGVGFLGAGVIFVKGGTVKGLTTAAGIWATAAVGMAVGSGMYPLGLFMTFVVVVLQMILHHLNVGDDAFSTHEVVIEMKDTVELRQAVSELFEEYGVQVLDSKITKEADDYICFRLSVKMSKSIGFDKSVEFIDTHPGIKTLAL